jgi:hypothetical protein
MADRGMGWRGSWEEVEGEVEVEVKRENNRIHE